MQKKLAMMPMGIPATIGENSGENDVATHFTPIITDPPIKKSTKWFICFRFRFIYIQCTLNIDH
jgi:hypothetical protein